MKEYRPSQEIRCIGIMGGTFDPIHYGHLVVAEEVRTTLNLAEMVFVPAGQPPHKPEAAITAVEHRIAMLKLALASNPYFSFSRVDVDRVGPSYTVDTLRLLRQQWGEETALYFVVGWDSLEELHTWYDPTGVLVQLTALVAIHRPGYQEVSGYRQRLEERLPAIRHRLLTMPAPQLDISATDLRQRVAEGRPIKYQLPEAVEQYIAQHGLYRKTLSRRGGSGQDAEWGPLWPPA